MILTSSLWKTGQFLVKFQNTLWSPTIVCACFKRKQLSPDSWHTWWFGVCKYHWMQTSLSPDWTFGFVFNILPPTLGLCNPDPSASLFFTIHHDRCFQQILHILCVNHSLGVAPIFLFHWHSPGSQLLNGVWLQRNWLLSSTNHNPQVKSK